MRINKYLAKLGIASRRKIDFLISKEKILVNDKLAILGQKIDPDVDVVKIKPAFFPTKNIDVVAQTIQPDREFQDRVYFLVYKPEGVVSSTVSYGGEQCVLDLLPKDIVQKYRLFPVGRLDQDSSGLIILTNDGQFTHKYTQPSQNISKVYHVLLDQEVSRETILDLQQGVEIELQNRQNGDKYTYQTNKCNVKTIQNSQYISHETTYNQKKSANLLEVTLFEGKNRQIRKMFQTMGFEVVSLVRVSVGQFQLNDLKPSEWTKVEFSM